MKTIRYCLLFICLILTYCSYGVSVRQALQAHPEIQVYENLYLNLQGQDIDSLDGLGEIRGIGRVRILNLSHNNLNHLDDRAFQIMPLLEELNLEYNYIEAVGNNLFATQRVYVNAAHNRLTQEQLQRLRQQLAPLELVQQLGMNVNRIYSRLLSFCWALALYPCLKYALSNPRLAKANFVLDAIVHGANIVDFFTHLRRANFRAALYCVLNGVHMYNSYKSPFTLADAINNHSDVDLKSFTTHPLVWLISWLPFFYFLPAPHHVQEAMLIPWIMCPSKYYKFFSGVDGMSKLLSLGVYAQPPRGGIIEMAIHHVARQGIVDAEDQVPLVPEAGPVD